VTDDKLLERVRKLLNKAEAEGCTDQEAQALTAKAAELMAKYGIDQALLTATKPEADKPVDKKFTIPAPYATVNSTLLYNIAKAMGCSGVRLAGRTANGVTLHLFGFGSDIERAELLYTSLLLQMANGLAHLEIPAVYQRDYAGRSRVKSYKRSWMLGFVGAVVIRVQAAERGARQAAERDTGRPGTALVLADRSVQVQSAFKAAYPSVRTQQSSSGGRGFNAGYASGKAANLGGTSVGRRSAGALR